ncbi:hypothetical protein EI42_05739 [Thermosporothrix hazakensis]|jgi:hypothetical protein|uniref:Uncharacterized protein n=1 Tax=Thermosporothrix hazakensis TaxID=644383 RepID=A0A326U5A2_THEHA|nr:hypothetical protein [Thermosporothrix hazakensis]PZW20978.1 hypothetical protein EI42_05739 [Thermosporothrix hazakensis]GCE49261.1 hypothetical protein KTH_41300 [Thermosporothrix hazakensis]
MHKKICFQVTSTGNLKLIEQDYIPHPVTITKHFTPLQAWELLQLLYQHREQIAQAVFLQRQQKASHE